MSELRALTMPKWGIEMTEGTITQWHVSVGDKFKVGDVLLSVETDKIINDIEAEYESSCVRVVSDVDETYPVGALLAVMGPAETGAEDIDAFIRQFIPVAPVDNMDASDSGVSADSASEPQNDDTRENSENTEKIESSKATYSTNTDLPLSPAAAAVAEHAAADLATLQGSGAGGRILKQDVEQRIRPPGPGRGTEPVDVSVDFGVHSQANATPIAKQYAAAHQLTLEGIEGSGRRGQVRLADIRQEKVAEEFVPFSPVQSRIAKKLSEAARDIPHFYLEIDVVADAMLRFRSEVSREFTINHMLLKAVANTLVEHPSVNVRVSDDGVQRLAGANLAIAVAADQGLMTPVIRGADRLSLAEISQESTRLATGVREGSLTLDDYANGSFTVSNLGMFGITRFTSIINPPQGAILSVGAIRPQWEMGPHGPTQRSMIALSLGCDHRAIDGATGARFLGELKSRLERLDTI